MSRSTSAVVGGRKPDIDRIVAYLSDYTAALTFEALPDEVAHHATSSREVPYHRGHYKNPLSDQEVEEKFRALAQGVLLPDRIDTLLDHLWHLE